jgi:hypothetical protein
MEYESTPFYIPASVTRVLTDIRTRNESSLAADVQCVDTWLDHARQASCVSCAACQRAHVLADRANVHLSVARLSWAYKRGIYMPDSLF